MGDMPNEIELGYFYAPAPMSEYYYSVIDKETKADPLFQSGYIRADIHEAELTKLRNALDVAEGGLVQLLKCPDAQSKRWAEEAITVIKQAKGGA